MRIDKYFRNKYVLTSVAFLLGVFISLAMENKILDLNVPTSEKEIKKIALTFDDGPSDKTSQILDILKKQNARATFFVVGKYAQTQPDILKREVAEGNEVENHSYDHSKLLANLNSKDLLENIGHAQSVITNILGENVNQNMSEQKYFRPPYGNVSAHMIKTLNTAGYKTVLWDVDPRDWDVKNNPQYLEDYILKNVFNHSIILLHDGKSIYQGTESKKITDENTESILEDLIVKLKAQNFEFVTINNLYK